MNTLKLALCAGLALSMASCGGGDKDKKDTKSPDGKIEPPDQVKDAGKGRHTQEDAIVLASAKLDEVRRALADLNLEAAEAGLKALVGMRDKLPADLREKIDAMAAQLAGAKNAPKLPVLK